MIHPTIEERRLIAEQLAEWFGWVEHQTRRGRPGPLHVDACADCQTVQARLERDFAVCLLLWEVDPNAATWDELAQARAALLGFWDGQAQS